MVSGQMTLRPPFLLEATIFPLDSCTPTQPNEEATRHDQSSSTAFSPFRVYLAASFSAQNEVGDEVGVQRIQEGNVQNFLGMDLRLTRLDRVERYLNYCAQKKPARPLHEHFMENRSITATENVGLHLVCPAKLIFIKPMPAYLLHYKFWEAYLSEDAELHSDLRIAKKLHLLPKEVEWKSWTKFVDSFLLTTSGEFSPCYSSKLSVHNRYAYGEINLPKLNTMYRYSPETNGLGIYVTGYGQFSAFFERNFAWMGLGFLYLVAILTAMQVGLAADHFKDKDSFNWASGSFSVFCIFLSVIILALPILRHALYFIFFTSGFMRDR